MKVKCYSRSLVPHTRPWSPSAWMFGWMWSWNKVLTDVCVSNRKMSKNKSALNKQPPVIIIMVCADEHMLSIHSNEIYPAFPTFNRKSYVLLSLTPPSLTVTAVENRGVRNKSWVKWSAVIGQNLCGCGIVDPLSHKPLPDFSHRVSGMR